MELLYIGAGLAVGLAGLGVGVWEGILAQKSIEVIGKNPKMSWSFLVLTILGIALVESAAIYGLIIALQIINIDPSLVATMGYKAIAAWAGVGFAWLGVGIGEWLLCAGAMESVLRNPESKGKILTFMILFLALVESSAIYGLIIALQLLS